MDPKHYKNGVILVASYPDGACDRHSFDRCPGAYLRPASYSGFSVSVDGVHTPFDIAWPAHFAFTNGQPVSDGPIPAKLSDAIRMIEIEIREREAIKAHEMKRKSEQSRLEDKRTGLVARG